MSRDRRHRPRALGATLGALLLSLAAVCGAGPAGATADGVDAALAALERGDVDTAVPALRALAEAGDTSAQDALAALYLRGIGVETDVTRAMQWYCRVAHTPSGGRPVMRAAWLLAEYFRTGGGVPSRHYLDGDPARIDPMRAYFWFSVMANQSALYADIDADSVTLGKIGMNAMGRELYDEEKAGLARAVSAWSPARTVASGPACLALPDGLPGG